MEEGSEARADRSYMCKEREAMATTSFVGEREMENGFEGRAMVEVG